MKHLLIILLACVSYAAAAQCKYEINETDDFTKQRIRQTKPVVVMKPYIHYPVVHMSLRRVDSLYSVVVTVFNTKPMCSGRDASLAILCDDDSVTTLPGVGQGVECSELQHERVMNMIISHYTRAYEISKKELIELSKKQMKKIRLSMTDEPIDVDFTEKNVNKKKAANFFADWVHCIASMY